MAWAQWDTVVTVVAAVGKEKPRCRFSSAKAQKQACCRVRFPQRIAHDCYITLASIR
jgi:hypothetical protein